MRNGTVSGKESASSREITEQPNALGRKRHIVRKRKSMQKRRRMAQIKIEKWMREGTVSGQESTGIRGIKRRREIARERREKELSQVKTAQAEQKGKDKRGSKAVEWKPVPTMPFRRKRHSLRKGKSVQRRRRRTHKEREERAAEKSNVFSRKPAHSASVQRQKKTRRRER
jgi:hypothetical protein